MPARTTAHPGTREAQRGSHAALWLWDRLTAPARAIRAPERRRRARMLSLLLLFLLTAAGILMWLLPWIVAPHEHAANLVLATTGIGVCAAGTVIYLLSRTRHYEAAVWLAVFTTLASVGVSTYTSQDSIWLEGSPYFLAVAVLLAAVLLPLVATLTLAAATLALPLVFHLTIPSFNVQILANATTFLAVFSGIVIISALVHHLDLLQIHHQGHALRDSRDRHRALFESSFEGLVLHTDGQILDVNDAATRIWGQDRMTLVGRTLDSLVVEDSRRHLSRSVQALHHTLDEAIALRADGSRFPVEFITKPHLVRGRLLLATGFRDITTRKENEAAREKARELQVANERLHEIERFKMHILNVTSHELNTPMTPLRMQVHLLKTGNYGDLNGKQRDAVLTLDRNLARLTVLVRDILDVSRLETGRLRVSPRPVDAMAAAREAVAGFQEAAREYGVRLEVSAPGEAWVPADPVRLQQVLTNLVSNALKFTPSGGRVHVEAIHHEKEDMVVVAVTDTGLGLDAGQQKRIFEPFEQVHLGAPTRERGSGLGLFISKEIVESHGGSLRVESPGPGQGSRFLFTLPRSSGPQRGICPPRLHRPATPAPQKEHSFTSTQKGGGL